MSTTSKLGHLAMPTNFLRKGKTRWHKRISNPKPFGPRVLRSDVAPHRLGLHSASQHSDHSNQSIKSRSQATNCASMKLFTLRYIPGVPENEKMGSAFFAKGT